MSNSTNQALLLLASQPRSLFIGQGVEYDSSPMYKDLEGVPAEQRIEFPVAEELNLGVGIGLALEGWLPILLYPRIDFLLRAADQLINHLDKIEQMSCGQWKPKVIIRTRVGSKKPLDAGPQHTQCHVKALRLMLTTVKVIKIEWAREAVAVYRQALEEPGSFLVVEELHYG